MYLMRGEISIYHLSMFIKSGYKDLKWLQRIKLNNTQLKTSVKSS